MNASIFFYHNKSCSINIDKEPLSFPPLPLPTLRKYIHSTHTHIARLHLLLSETNRLLDGPRELLRERVVRLVRRQVEAVEARVRLG